MQVFSQYGDIRPQLWDSLVNRSAWATWFQTREAYLFYTRVSQEMTPFVFGVEEGAVLTGVIVGYVTKAQNAIKQFVTRRAIIVGGALLDEHITDEALAALLSVTRHELSRKAIYIEFRNLHDYSRWRDVFAAQGFDYLPHLNYQVDCSSDMPTIMARMARSRRWQIRKGVANGAQIVEAQSDDDVQAYYAILRDLYGHKLRRPLPSVDFFMHLYHSDNAKFLLVRYREMIIGGVVCPVLAHRAIYEWYICGLDTQYRQQYPSVLATYAVIEYAAQHNIPLFDFMGAGQPDMYYGVRTFKSRFGGTEIEYGRFLYVCTPYLYRLAKWVVRRLDSI